MCCESPVLISKITLSLVESTALRCVLEKCKWLNERNRTSLNLNKFCFSHCSNLLFYQVVKFSTISGRLILALGIGRAISPLQGYSWSVIDYMCTKRSIRANTKRWPSGDVMLDHPPATWDDYERLHVSPSGDQQSVVCVEM